MTNWAKNIRPSKFFLFRVDRCGITTESSWGGGGGGGEAIISEENLQLCVVSLILVLQASHPEGL